MAAFIPTQYGLAADPLMEFDPRWDEFMHYLYLPVKMPGTDVRIPERLGFLSDVIDKIEGSGGAFGVFDDDYVYITARRGFATPDNPLNRPGWHCDGFGTDDINFVWSDCYPTRVAVQPFHAISTDHKRSLAQFDEQVDLDFVHPLEPKVVSIMNPFVVHATPIIPEGGCMRSFFKISVSDHKYNLLGNSHNYLFDYDWKMYDRSAIRNDPAYSQGDFYDG